MRTMQSILIGAVESPSTAIPRIAARRADRRKTLDKPVATVNSPSINRVKPSDHFMPKEQALVRML